MTEFSFGQVEATLASINGIADHKRVAFTGRLKFLQKNGLLGRARDKPGRGKAGVYDFAQMVKLALGVELLTFGLTPQRTAQLVERNWDHLRWSSYLSTFSQGEAREFAERGYGDDWDPPETNWLWLVNANALAELTTEGAHEWDTQEAIEAVSLKELPKMLEMYGNIGEAHGRRTMLVNGSAMVRTVLHKVAFDFRFATIEEMREDLLADARRHQDELDRIGDLLDNIPEEKKAEIRARMAKNREEGFSQLRQEAADILKRLSPAANDALKLLVADEDIPIDDGRDALIELIEFGLLEAPPEDRLEQYGRVHLVLTSLGGVLIELYKGGVDVSSQT